MDNILARCPACGFIPKIDYACGEYFVVGSHTDCPVCDDFSEMHSSEVAEIEAWNKRAKMDQLKNVIICIGKMSSSHSACIAAFCAALETYVNAQIEAAIGEKEKDAFRELGIHFSDLMQAIEDQSLADMAVEYPPEKKDKQLRPPKRIGPISKNNYNFNKPPRHARSCLPRK